MKIKKEHFETLKTAIDATLEKHNSRGELIADYEKGNFSRADKVTDLQRRFCFDVLYGSGLTIWVSDNLSYLTDDHIFSALKKVCPIVARKY